MKITPPLPFRRHPKRPLTGSALLQSAERMLADWGQKGVNYEENVRRNRSLLKLWKQCAVEQGWMSWSTLPPNWQLKFLGRGASHIAAIDDTHRLCMSALTGGLEDFPMSTCKITALWGMNAFSAPTMTILPPSPLTSGSATSHRIFCRTFDIWGVTQ